MSDANYVLKRAFKAFLPATLTPSDRAAILERVAGNAAELAHVLAEIERLQHEAVSLRGEIARDGSVLKTGVTARLVECEERQVQDGAVVAVRLDTGERVAVGGKQGELFPKVAA